MATRTSVDAQRVREVDRVLQDVDLFLQRRRDVDRGVGDDQCLLVTGHVHHEAVADAPRGAQAGVALDHGGHQLVGVQAALHQRLGLALAHQLHRRRGGRLAVRRIDDLHAGEIDAAGGGDAPRCARAARPGSARSGRAGPPRIAPSSEDCIARMRDGGRRGRQRLAEVDQALVLLRVSHPSRFLLVQARRS